jgi:hypothetical protein
MVTALISGAFDASAIVFFAFQASFMLVLFSKLANGFSHPLQFHFAFGCPTKF